MQTHHSFSEKKLQFDRRHYADEELVAWYKQMLYARLIEEKMLALLRQGKVSKWFSGIGQEAIAVGVTAALENNEYILPLHRNLGVFTSRNINLKQLAAQWMGKSSGFTKGRDRSFHFGSLQHHIVGMISHLGANLPLANGIALAELLEKREKVVVAFSGDGGTSEGDFHEALNVAAVWSLPVIFLIENNGYGLSTTPQEQYKCKNLIDKGIGYGIPAVQIDGNNIIEVYDTLHHLAESIRATPSPVLVEAVTFRMRGHEEASGTKYVPKELLAAWEKRDPLIQFENYLMGIEVIDAVLISVMRNELKTHIDEAIDAAFQEPEPVAESEQELQDVYYAANLPQVAPDTEQQTEKRFIDAITDGLTQSLERYEKLLVMGQDIADYGGVFKVTEGLAARFGKDRIRNTPLCESAIVGMSVGLSVAGYKSVVEMQFADFVSCAFNQTVNNIAKQHYRWGKNVDVVIRMPTGAGTSGGPFHSQSNEAWFFHTPGLKIVYPSTPYQAKGLLCAAIADENPYLYFEHKYLYRSLTGLVPNNYYTLPIGQAFVAQEGNELSVITYGMGVHWAITAAQETGISADVIDLATLLPWDKETVLKSVKKTGKVLVCHEDTLTGGIGAEIAAWIAEYAFQHLDAPVLREGSLDTPVPFHKNLEQNFLPAQRIKTKMQWLASF
jgi:2-oxoisovalerate dehydrogenase E1 component